MNGRGGWLEVGASCPWDCGLTTGCYTVFVLVGDRSVAEAFDEWINQGSLNCMTRSRDHMNCMILT